MRRFSLIYLLLMSTVVPAQERSLFQSDFPSSEFTERRNRVFERIGEDAVAIIQGAAGVDGFKVFRQSNEFYYLCGVETPHAYLLLDGRNKRTTLYLPHRDEGRERSEGKILSAEDAELAKSLTGVEQVFGVEVLSRHMRGMLLRPPAPVLFTPFSPSEGVAQSRDEHLTHLAGLAADPWDGRPSKEGHFRTLIQERFPTFEIKDLSPILDGLRMIKSEKEITLIRRASEVAGLGLLEAMRSTRPDVYEYQLDAAARYVFLVNGARHEGYSSITAGGRNAWMGHYFHNASRLKDGDMVLMDFAPDYRYYTSDITRMWPVNGKHTAEQRTMAEIILRYRNALLKRIKHGVSPQEVLDGARAEMEPVIRNTRFSKEHHRKAAEGMLTFRGHLSHPVGMTVHDVGTYWRGTFQKGHVFSVDPMLWIPEEQLYIRMEDVVAVTETGVELFTDFLPSSPDEIEAAMREEGIVQLRPPMKLKR